MILQLLITGTLVISQVQFSSTYSCEADCPLNYDCNDCGPSPINIVTSEVIDVDLPPLALQNAPNEFGTMINDGVTLEVFVQQPTKCMLSGGPFACRNETYTYYKDRYYFINGVGEIAQTTINGDGSNVAVDLHFFNSLYTSFEEALNYANGVVVMSILFSLGEQEIKNFDYFANATRQVPTPKSSTRIQEGPYYSWQTYPIQSENFTYLFYQGEYSATGSAGADTCAYCATRITVAPDSKYFFNATLTQSQFDESFGQLRNFINRPQRYLSFLYRSNGRSVYRASGINNYNV